MIPVDANAAVLTALNARASDSCSPAKANDVVRAVGNLLDNPQIVTPVRQVHRRRRRRRCGDPVRAHSRQLRIRERARLREHVLRRDEQPVPEHVRARLPADRRPAGRRQLLGQGAVRPRARGRTPRRDAEPDPRPDHPVHHAERRDQPDAGSDDGLRLPHRRRDEDLRGLQGQGGDEQRAGADQQHLVEERLAGRDVPGLEPAARSTRSTRTTTTSARCLPTRTPRTARRSSSRRPISRDARRPGGSSSRWAAIPRSRSPTSSLGNPLNADWSQAYAQSGAIVYMGNTGYGLGDTAAVLYSEKLNLLFADRLDGSMTVGQALAFAKQEYAATPTQSGYHLKVIDEATMMGLPMYRVGTGVTAPPQTPAITTTDSATGLPSAPFTVTPSFTARQHGDRRATTPRTTPSPRTAGRSSRRRSSTSRSRASWRTARCSPR